MTELLTPNPKAGAEPLPPGFEDCGCCNGVLASTPQIGGNRIGLSSISYRIGDQAQFRASLIAGLNTATLPALAGLRTREASDFTIGLIDAFACAADVLTFYQERIAQESFLRTATERVSMQEMGRLIGYRLKPGVAAETQLAFALETPPTPPAGLAPEPGNFVTGVPAAVTLAKGLKVQSLPGPDETPQAFETVESIEAQPAWNAIRPWLSEVRKPGRGDRETFLAGVRTGLRAGDALLIVDDEFSITAASDHWDFRLLATVEPDAANDRTRITWKRGLGSIVPFVGPAQQPQAYALRKRAAAYGHNAPKWRSMLSQFRTDYVAAVGSGSVNQGEWPGFSLSPARPPRTRRPQHQDPDDAPAGSNNIPPLICKHTSKTPSMPRPAATASSCWPRAASTGRPSRRRAAPTSSSTRWPARRKPRGPTSRSRPRSRACSCAARTTPSSSRPRCETPACSCSPSRSPSPATRSPARCAARRCRRTCPPPACCPAAACW